MGDDDGIVIVEFIGKYSPYNVGEVAGFKQQHADALVRAKRAKLYRSPFDKMSIGEQTKKGKKRNSKKNSNKNKFLGE